MTPKQMRSATNYPSLGSQPQQPPPAAPNRSNPFAGSIRMLNGKSTGPSSLTSDIAASGFTAVAGTDWPVGSGSTGVDSNSAADYDGAGAAVGNNMPALPHPPSSFLGSFSQSLSQQQTSQPNTPLDMSEFPALGGAALGQGAIGAGSANSNNGGIGGLKRMGRSTSSASATAGSLGPGGLSNYALRVGTSPPVANSRNSPSLGSTKPYLSTSGGISSMDVAGASLPNDFPALGGTQYVLDNSRLFSGAAASADGTAGVDGSITEGDWNWQQQHKNSLLNTMTGEASSPQEALNRAKQPSLSPSGSKQPLSPSSQPQQLGSIHQSVSQPHDPAMSDLMKANSTSIIATGMAGLSVDNGSQQFSWQGSSAETRTMISHPIPDTSKQDQYGVRGLLRVIRMENPEANMMSLGSDLTTLGLNLNQPDDRPLYSDFLSPWTETINSKAIIEPEFHIPSCYNVQPPPPAQQRIHSFSDETLFYIFYSLPRDIMQELAAQELTNRNWRWHKEFRLWLTKEPGSEPIHRTELFERGVYIFFNPQTWERVKREFTLIYDHLDTRPSESAISSQRTPQMNPIPIGTSRGSIINGV